MVKTLLPITTNDIKNDHPTTNNRLQYTTSLTINPHLNHFTTIYSFIQSLLFNKTSNDMHFSMLLIVNLQRYANYQIKAHLPYKSEIYVVQATNKKILLSLAYLTSLLSRLSWVSSRGIDEGNYGEAKLICVLHETKGFTITLWLRHTKIALHVFLTR